MRWSVRGPTCRGFLQALRVVPTFRPPFGVWLSVPVYDLDFAPLASYVLPRGKPRSPERESLFSLCCFPIVRALLVRLGLSSPVRPSRVAALRSFRRLDRGTIYLPFALVYFFFVPNAKKCLLPYFVVFGGLALRYVLGAIVCVRTESGLSVYGKISRATVRTLTGWPKVGGRRVPPRMPSLAA